MPADPRNDYALVTSVLDEVVEGPRAAARDLARSLAKMCPRSGRVAGSDGGLEAARRRIAACSTDELSEVIRYLATRFHLLNNAEKASIVRINRERECAETYDRPRAESIAEGLVALRDAGLSADETTRLLAALDIQPTLTAHPTETRRRSVQLKLQEVSDLLLQRRGAETTPSEGRQLETRLREIALLLTVTDDVRSQRLGVLEEVRNGLHFLTGSIWDAVPLLARDVVDGLQGVHGDAADVRSVADLPVLVRYRTWMGGDRDGNPRVTPDVTRRALSMLAGAAREKIAESLETLRRELSVSDRRCDIPATFRAAIERDAAFGPDDPGVLAHTRHEPVRVRILQIKTRLRDDPAYTARQLLADLEAIRDCLRATGLAVSADDGPLAELILRVRVFGLHMASMDIRRHSGVHERVVDEMLRLGGVCPDYATRDEPARLEVLRRELANTRPLLRPDASVSDETADTLELLRVVAEAQAREPDAVRAYVISMTHTVSDLLEVQLLMKETGLFRPGAGGQPTESTLDIVPLLETVEDLRRGPELMAALFDEPAYRAQMTARGAVESGDGTPFQEIMLGYSDSNKDGGFLMANAALHDAQERICVACHNAGVAFRLFHGRGGTVGRGGGRAGRAILSMPPAAHNGRIRFTEQGEVISFRYGVPAIARRHLEQIVSAMIVSAQHGEARAEAAPETPAAAPLLADLATRSMQAYRALIDDPEFWPWFTAVSPVSHIGGLPIASRPVARTSGDITFDTLRAIPWVFSWIQMRYLAPSWYGMGAALGTLDADGLAACSAAYREWTFFQTVIDNAQREMARARLDTARFYAIEHPSGPRMHDLIERDFTTARAAILRITGQHELLEREPVIARAIDARNPWTDVLNLAQIELLGRARDGASDAGADGLEHAIHASVNAIAAAMQSTG